MARDIGLGIAGLGRGLSLTLPALLTSGIAIVAAFDPHRDTCTAFARDFAASAHASFEALIGDPRVDAVYIASPHEFHEAQAIAALLADKHVLVDKPMAIGVAACARIAAAQARSGKILMVGPSHGADPAVDVAAQLIADGRIGAPQMITAINFTDYLYRPRRAAELDPARGGGVVWGQGPHQVDIVRRLAGAACVSVDAVVTRTAATHAADGAYSAFLRFARGRVASLAYSGHGRFDSDTLCGDISELGRAKPAFDPGAVRRRSIDATAKRARGYGSPPAAPPPHNEHFGFILVAGEHGDMRVGADRVTLFTDATIDVPVALARPARAATVAAFAAAIASGKPPQFDAAWGSTTIAICAAMIASSDRGTPVIL